MLVPRAQCFLQALLTHASQPRAGVEVMSIGRMSPVSNRFIIPFHSSQLSPKEPGDSYLWGEVFVLSPGGVNTIVFILKTGCIASGYRILKKLKTCSLVIVRENSSSSRTLN